jgi:hypothetical protein
MTGLVAYLDAKTNREGCRLRKHTMESFLEDISWIKDLMPDDLAIDPERPIIEESIYEMISRDKGGLFAKGLLLLSELALKPTPQLELQGEGMPLAATNERHTEQKKINPESGRKLNSRGGIPWKVALFGFAIVLAVWLLFAAF